MVPQPRLALIVGGLCLLALASTTLFDRAGAQDQRAAADRYAESLLLTPEDLPGYIRGNPPPVRPATGMLANRIVFLQKTGQGVPDGVGVTSQVVVWETNQAADADIEATRDWVRAGNRGIVLGGPYAVSLPGAEDAYQFITQGSYTDYGRGVLFWRRANVLFWLHYYYRPAADAREEGLRLAESWNAKAERIGPFGSAGGQPASTPARTPAATLVPATPSPEPTEMPRPSPTPTATPVMPSVERRPDMTVLVAARVGGALVPDGTPITALIDGKECGNAMIRQGFAMLTVAGGDPGGGCGVPGSTISFRFAEATANETLPWNDESLAGLVELSTTSPLVGGGLLRRPMLQRSCGNVAMPCSAAERARWSGDRAAWQAELAARGEEASSDALLRAWMEFRADSGEAFSSLVLAVLSGRPFTFILAVRYGATAAEPEPYISIINLGADRQVGGWKLRTTGDMAYTFPEGGMLRQGYCRVFTNPLNTPESGSACGSASFPPPGAALPPLGGEGFVELVDDQGNVIDSVGW